MSLFQSNLRKQIRNLPKIEKILNFVKIIHYYSKLFTGVLRRDPRVDAQEERGGQERGDGAAPEARGEHLGVK